MLVLDEEVPRRPDSGKANRTIALLSRASEQFDITLLTHRSAQDGGETAGALPSRVRIVHCDSRVPDKAGLLFYLRLLLNVFSPRPYSVSSHFSRALLREARRLAPEADVFHCEWTPYAIYALRAQARPRTLTAHNVESDIWRGYLDHERSLLRKAYIYLQWRKMLKFERSVFPLFDSIFAVSAVDAARIRQLGGRNITVVENGVDTQFFSPQPEMDSVDRILFCGALDWRPNLDGLRFFVGEVWPRIRSMMPACVLRIVGRRPSTRLIAELSQSAGVEMVGEVDDVRPHFAATKVVIVPLRIGGGTRLKIVEAWSMQRAVVSTRLGAAGLPARSGENILLADSPIDFARAVVELLRDPDRRRAVADGGRQEAVTGFDWEPLAAKQSRIWSSL